MNRRSFIGMTTGTLVGAAAAIDPVLNMDYSTLPVQTNGPYSIEIVSPQQEAGRELPLFDTYKSAENFAQARMHILRCNHKLTKLVRPEDVGTKYAHEAGLIKVWTAKNELIFECAWGETWTSAHSYVDVEGRLS